MTSKVKHMYLTALVAATCSAPVMGQTSTDDAGDVATRWTGYFTSFEGLVLALSGFGGLILVLFGIFTLTKKDVSPGGQGNRAWGWVMLIGGGAMSTIATIRAIMSNSTVG